VPAEVLDVVFMADQGGPDVVLVVARCGSASTQSTGIYVYGLAADGSTPVLRQTVLAQDDNLVGASNIRVGDGRVTVDVTGYSSPSVSRCCPDQALTLAWRWSDGAVSRSAPSPLHA
jgi:hypothetical protein